jgi:hypothetical protein
VALDCGGSGGDSLYVACFPPYSPEEHANFVARSVAAGAAHEVIGRTLDGRPLDLLRIGDGPKKVWLLGRQVRAASHAPCTAAVAGRRLSHGAVWSVVASSTRARRWAPLAMGRRVIRVPLSIFYMEHH